MTTKRKPTKWYFCTWPGCKVRRGTPQAIRVHRRDDHGEAWTKAERRDQEKIASRARTAAKATKAAVPTDRPARPAMAKVSLASALEKIPELILAELPDSVLVAEVADRLQRKAG